MRRTIALLALPLLLGAMASAADRRDRAEERDMPLPVAEVVAAERAFAARAQQVDPRDAFAEHFAPDGSFFGPTPGPAFPGLREGPPWGIDIRWRPVDAGISRSADLGWTTGPAEYRRTKADAPHRWGYYASVWIKQPDGRWQVAIDGGITVPQPTVAVADWQPDPRRDRHPHEWRPRRRAPSVEQRADELLHADRKLAAKVGDHGVRAFDGELRSEIRFQRDGKQPALGRTAVLDALRDGASTYAWSPAGGRVARSGELGYSWGSGEKRTTTGPQPFHYLAVWEKHEGRWKLRLLVHSLPPKPQPATG